MALLPLSSMGLGLAVLVAVIVVVMVVDMAREFRVQVFAIFRQKEERGGNVLARFSQSFLEGNTQRRKC